MSKFSSFKEHQLIVENWRRYINEEQEEPLADKAEEVLKELSEDQIQDAISSAIEKGELPPEMEDQIETVANAVATQALDRGQEGLDEAKDQGWRTGYRWTDDSDEPGYVEGDPADVESRQSTMDALAKLGAGLGFVAGWPLTPLMIDDAVGGFQKIGAVFTPLATGAMGLMGGMAVAMAIIMARQKMFKALSQTQVVEPVSGPDPEEELPWDDDPES